MKKMYLLPACMCIALIMSGGFFDSSVAFIGIAIVVCFLIMLIKGENFFVRDKRIVFLIPAMLFGVSVLVSFWAVDYMDNFMGAMRLGVLCLWLYLVRCRGKEESLAAKKMLPLLGCISVLISVISLCIPLTAPHFWENGRMSGFFQYANTNGLFFAIGMMILIHDRKEQKKKITFIVQMIVLLIGLLLTGSRSVLLLFMVWGIWCAVKMKEFRKPFFIGTAILLCTGGIYTAVTQDVTNIGRIFTIFTSNSTLWGRLLYYRDAVFAICRNFFGLGRMGYAYGQGTFQSGVYHVKFVHNDFLQMALDYGVIALILLLLFFGWQIFCGKQSREEKEILVFLGAASLVDFHCQYLFIVMLACLFLDYGDCVKEKKAQVKENYIFMPLCLLVFLYVGIATESSRLGNQEMALSMFPDYTYAQEKKLLALMGSVEGVEEVHETASRLIQKNPYNLTAYLTRGTVYASMLSAKECMADLDKLLELDPYNVEYYAQYEIILKNMKAQIEALSATSEGQETSEILQLLQNRIDSLPAQLAEMEERTSALAYKIKDLPVFAYK